MLRTDHESDDNVCRGLQTVTPENKEIRGVTYVLQFRTAELNTLRDSHFGLLRLVSSRYRHIRKGITYRGVVDVLVRVHLYVLGRD